MAKLLGRDLYDFKKWEHKQKEDQGKSFGKSFNYEMGKKKSQNIARGRAASKALNKQK